MDIPKKTIVSAISCESYAQKILFEKVSEAIECAGGLPAKFKPGIKVLINPNFLTAVPPETATTTHPEIVRAVIRYLRDKNINDITVGDSPAGDHPWDKLWEITGFKTMADEERVKLLPFENVTRLEVNGVGTVPILRELTDFDAVISMPKLKPHMLTKITGAVKNTFGLVIGGAKSHFHGLFQSPRKMAHCLVMIYKHLKPDFVIMDAVICMEKNGPSGGNPVTTGIVFAGTDSLAVDACACNIYDYIYTDIPMLAMSENANVGIADPEKIIREGNAWDKLKNTHAQRSKSDLLHKIPEKMFHFITYIVSCRPHINPDKCVKCGLCAKTCSQSAIIMKDNFYHVKNSKCILCICCFEACPHHAIELLSPAMRLKRLLFSLVPRKADK